MKRKILHGMSDVAGQATYSVKGLIANGEDASLAVWRKNPFNYSNSFCLNIGHNKLLYPYYAMKMFGYGIYAMFKYDIFHFHFGYSLFPFGLDLYFLKKLNKTVVMEYHGSDIRWVFNRERPEFLHQEELPSFSNRIRKRILRTFKYVDQFILHDYELLEHLPDINKKVFFVPLRIEIGKFIPQYPSVSYKKPIIVHAPSNSIAKGSKYIIEAIENLKKRYDFEFILVKDMPQEEAIRVYSRADIIVDQLFAGTYGVLSIEAMALGKPVIAYITEEMRKQFPDELPIVSATILTIEEKIELLLNEPQLRHDLGVKGRKYAENYHDYRVIGKKLVEIYSGGESPCSPKEAFERIKRIKENLEKER